jgi:maltooligosyltrehalose trehalohydrolase
MGEEWGAGTPWQFFTDHTDPGLAEATSEGRRAEFASHGWSGDVPDPQDPATFTRSKLDWSELERPGHVDLLRWYRDLIALRTSRRGALAVVANLTDERQELQIPGELVLSWQDRAMMKDDTVVLPGSSVAVLDERRE